MKSRLKYNICFIKQGDRILLLNREKPSWMGCWNGVGGKLEPEESPTQSMIREISGFEYSCIFKCSDLRSCLL